MRFASDEVVQAEVERFLREAAVEWYDAGIQKLVTRMQKVIEKNDDYIEY